MHAGEDGARAGVGRRALAAVGGAAPGRVGSPVAAGAAGAGGSVRVGVRARGEGVRERDGGGAGGGGVGGVGGVGGRVGQGVGGAGGDGEPVEKGAAIGEGGARGRQLK